jgi:hypothetical protein
MIVGCLPPFAVFIRGRVVASRASGYSGSASTNKPGNPSSYVSNSRAKSRARVESVLLDDVEPPAERRDADNRSNKSLVEGTIVVTHGWNQKWHRGTKDDEQRERIRKLGLNGNV